MGLLESEEIALAQSLVEANSLKGKDKKAAQELAYKTAAENINAIANGGDYGLNRNYYNTALQRINSLYNNKDNVNALSSWLIS